jgi:hypothetical protein
MKLFADPASEVQLAACEYAEKAKDPKLVPVVLGVLKAATDDWQFRAAASAARALNARRDRMHILVNRLDEDAMTARFLSVLVDDVVANTTGYGYSSDQSNGKGQACKKAWREFLAQHETRLLAGKRFRLDDPAFPVKKLFPGYTFYPTP